MNVSSNYQPKHFLRSVCRLLVTANVNSSLIFVTLMMQAMLSSETLVLTRASWNNIPEDGILIIFGHDHFPFPIYLCYSNTLIRCMSSVGKLSFTKVCCRGLPSCRTQRRVVLCEPTRSWFLARLIYDPEDGGRFTLCCVP
jgi:hypothetical protein